VSSVQAGCNKISQHGERTSQEVAATGWQQQVELVAAGRSSSIQLDEPASQAFLAELPRLEGKLLDLLLDAGGLDDAAFGELRRLPSLEHLRIRLANIGDAGMRMYAGGDRKLKILNLPQSSISADGISELAKLSQLQQLRLGGRQLDDRAAEELAKLPALKSLHLIGPSITAQGLKHLAQAPHLTSLYIDDCPGLARVV
jgi:hypothetical protein